MNDFVLDVVCDHAGRLPEPAEPRTVARIIHVPPAPGAYGAIVWQEALLDDGTDPGAAQTYYSEAHRLGTFDVVPSMTEAQRWRFHCPTCEDTVPRKHTKMEPFLEGLRHAGVTTVCLSALERYTL